MLEKVLRDFFIFKLIMILIGLNIMVWGLVWLKENCFLDVILQAFQGI